MIRPKRSLRSNSAAVLLGVALLGSSACLRTIPYYRYEFGSEARLATPIKRVVIQPLGISEVPELQSGMRLEPMIEAYVKEHGFVVVPFDEALPFWKASLAAHGPLYHPKTGALDINAMQLVYRHYLEKLAAEDLCDAVIEADVVGRTAKLERTVALWDGVERRIPTKSAGQQFDWTGTANVLSLRVIVLSTNGELLLRSYGGLEYPYAHSVASGKSESELRDDLFQNEAFLQQGIAIAFHPLITYPDYPSNPKFYDDIPR